MLSPSKLIHKAEAAKFARQLQHLNKERLDEWVGRRPRAAPRGKPKPKSLMGGQISQWRNCIERERRVAAGAGSSVDVQQHVKRARWYVDQRDVAARVLQSPLSVSVVVCPVIQRGDKDLGVFQL